MNKLSRAAVAIAMIVGLPVAACTWRGGSAVDGARADPAAEDTVRGENFNSSLPSNIDRSLQRQVQTAQTSKTIRQQENERSGGTSTGGSNAPAPNTVKPQGGDS